MRGNNSKHNDPRFLNNIGVFKYQNNKDEDKLAEELQKMKTQQLKFLKETDWMFENKSRLDPKDYFHKHL